MGFFFIEGFFLVCAEEGPLPNKERVATPSPATSATETILPHEDDDPLSIQNKKISFGRTTSDPSNSRALEQLSSPPVFPVTAAAAAADRRRDSTDGGGVNSAEKSNLMDFVIDAGEYSQVYSTAQQQQIHPENTDQSHRIDERMDRIALSDPTETESRSRKALLPPGQFYKTPNDLSHLSAVEIPKQKPGSSGLFNFPNASSSSSSSSSSRRSSAPQAATALPKEQKEKEKKNEYAAPRPESVAAAYPATPPEVAASYANATTSPVSPVDEENLPPPEAKKPPSPSPPRKRKEPTCTREDLMPTWQLRKEDIKVIY